jgi:hypothetical protein
MDLDLKAGKIPDELREEFRLVDPQSREGLVFQKICESIARRLYTADEVVSGRSKQSESLAALLIHDFDAAPVRFLISKSDQANAMCLRSCPSTIILNEGLFKPQKPHGKVPVQSEEDLMIVLGHELTHAKFRDLHGDGPSSKPEEALCDAIPMRLLHYIGKDPAAILEFDERLRGSRGQRPTWGELFDAHLTGSSRQSVYEAALTELGQSIGAVSAKRGERTALPDGLIDTLRAAKHISFLDELKGQVGFTSMEPHDKADLLFKTIGQIGTDFPVRAADLAKELASIGLSVDRKADRASIDLWVNELSSFFQSLKKDSSFSAHTPQVSMSSMYEALSAATGTSDRIRPLGKAFREISLAMREVRDATAEESLRDLKSACSRLVKLYNNFEWCSSVDGREFVRCISWPTFKLPSVEKIVSRERPQVGEWNFMAEHADSHPDIALAGVIMGLAPDRRIRLAAKSYLGRTDLISFDRLIQQRGSNLISSVTSGPQDQDGSFLHHCSMDRHGRITGMDAERLGLFRDHVLTVSNDVAGEELTDLVSHLLVSGSGSPGSPASDLTPETLAGILSFKAVSAPQVLLDVLRTPGASCDPELLKVVLENSHFIVMHAKNASIALSHKEEFTERNILDLFAALSAAKASNRPLYDAVVELLPSKSFQLYYRDPHVERDARASSSQKTVTSPLRAFVTTLAPDLSDDQIRSVVRQAATETNNYVPDEMRSLCEKRLGYPKQISAKALLQWIDSQPQNSLFTDWDSISDGAPGSQSISGSMALCTTDLLGILQSGSLTSSDLVTIASICKRLEMGFNDPWRFLTSSEISPLIAKIPFEQDGPSVPDLARAWRDLYALDLLGTKAEERFLAHILSSIEKLELPSEPRRAALERLLSGSRIRQPELRDRIISMWVKDAALTLGADDRSEGFRRRVEERIQPLVDSTAGADLQQLGFELAESLLSQRECSMTIERLVQSSRAFSKFSLLALGHDAEALITVVKAHEEERNRFLRYLLSEGTPAETADLTEQIVHMLPQTGASARGFDDLESASRMITRNTLKMLHKEFWRLPLEGRALFAKELLPTAARLSVDNSFDFVVEAVLPPSMPHHAATRDLLKRYVHALPEHAQHLALVALLTAGQPGRQAATTPGAILAKFAESQGPAEIKFVQVLMDAPGLPDDFRRDLIEHARHLKYKTQAPSRAQIFRLLDIIEARDGVSFGHIGKLRGCGSMNIVVEVNEGLLCLRRPNCQARAEDGFDIMLRMVASMDKDDPIAQSIRPIITDARERASLESNFWVSKAQYERAAANYRGFVAHVDGHAIPLDSAEVFRSGEDFFTMSEMKGEHFITRLERDGTTPELQRMAKAILAREFNAILKGEFDCDRHGGQIAIGKGIGHFDFKAMALEQWSHDDHRQLAKVLISTAMLCSSPSDIAPVMVGILGQLREQGIPVSKMVTEAQKAILSLGDYFKALAPMSSETLMQLLTSGLSADMPPSLQQLYAEECADIVMPFIKKNSGIFGGMVPKKAVSALLRETIANGAPSPAIAKVLPKALQALLPNPKTRIRFERLPRPSSGGS